MYKVRAAFSKNGGASWQWLTWTVKTGNKHEAIIDKANAIGATSWDFGNADFARVSEAWF